MSSVKFEDRLNAEEIALAKEAARVGARSYADAVKALARGSEEMLRKEIAAKTARTSGRTVGSGSYGSAASEDVPMDASLRDYYASGEARRR